MIADCLSIIMHTAAGDVMDNNAALDALSRLRDPPGNQGGHAMSNRHLSWAIFLMVCAGGLGADPSLAVDAGSQPALDTVLAAWKAREEAVRSARFEWSGTSTHVVPAASLDSKASPEEQKVFTGKMSVSLVLDGEALRFRLAGQRFKSMRDKHLVWGDQTYTLVLGAKSNVHHFLNRNQIDPFDFPSIGSIAPAEHGKGLASRNFDVDPIVMHYRSSNPQMSNVAGSLSLMTKSGMVETDRCWIVKEDGQQPTEYWVDPQRDYAILRIRQFSVFKPDRCVVETEIAYKPDTLTGWVPATWKGTFIDQDSGNVKQSCEYTVTSYTLNPAVDPSEFEYQFPAGTRVVDRRTSPNVQYITREGREDRIITVAESGASYQDLMLTESGGAASIPGDAMRVRTNWLLLGGLLSLLAILIAVFAVRRKRMIHQP